MTFFLNQLLNALLLGGIYALIAVGYTMVYGIIKLINFAHGEIYMFGTFFCVILMGDAGLPFWLALPAAMAGCALLGLLIDVGAYRSVRNAPRLAALITAVGVSLFLQNLAMLIWGSEPRAFPEIAALQHTVDFQPGREDGFKVPVKFFLIWFLSIGLMLLTDLLIRKTKLGKAMRACSMDPKAAVLMGIPVNRIITTTFMLGSGMAAIAGACYGLYVGCQISFRMGVYSGVIAFAAAVLGGIGHMRGAFLGGLLMGLVEVGSRAYLCPALDISGGYSSAFAFSLLIAVILVRPTGILGSPSVNRA